MTITEFAREVGVEPQVISRYINRHEDEFKGLTKRVGKNVELTEGAIEILKKKYKPHIIIQASDPQVELEHKEEVNNLQKKLLSAQEMIVKLQNELSERTIELAESKVTAALLEDREAQLKREQERADQNEAELRKFSRTIFGLYKKKK